MEIDMRVLERLDGIILTGHIVSFGMRTEQFLAERKGLPVFNLVGKTIEEGIELLGVLMEEV